MAILETPNLSANGQERVLARIGTYAITEADVDRFISALGQRGEMYRQNPQGRKAVLEQMIAQKNVIDQQIIVYECRGKTAVELTALVLGRPVSRARAEKEKFHN